MEDPVGPGTVGGDDEGGGGEGEPRGNSNIYKYD